MHVFIVLCLLSLSKRTQKKQKLTLFPVSADVLKKHAASEHDIIFHVCTIQMFSCVFLTIADVRIISLFQEDFTSETPPTEDGRVRFARNCPFKCQ